MLSAGLSRRVLTNTLVRASYGAVNPDLPLYRVPAMREAGSPIRHLSTRA